MDAHEWLKSEDPRRMYAHVEGRVDPRKQRLLTCACVRSVWHHLRDDRFRDLVELSEEFADGRGTVEALDRAGRILFEIVSRNNLQLILTQPSLSAMKAALGVGNRSVSVGIDEALKYSLLSAAPCVLRTASAGPSQPDPEAQAAHSRQVADLFRDILGNPFEPLSMRPDWLAWNAGTVGRLAETIYAERRYQDLPVLADALEEAGCDEENLLDHLRSPGVHLRGCWALDLARGV